MLLQYLKDLSCPRAYKAGMNADEMAVCVVRALSGVLLCLSFLPLFPLLQVVLDWLLAHAVAAEYTDHGERSRCH